MPMLSLGSMPEAGCRKQDMTTLATADHDVRWLLVRTDAAGTRSPRRYPAKRSFHWRGGELITSSLDTNHRSQTRRSPPEACPLGRLDASRRSGAGASQLISTASAGWMSAGSIIATVMARAACSNASARVGAMPRTPTSARARNVPSGPLFPRSGAVVRLHKLIPCQRKEALPCQMKRR